MFSRSRWEKIVWKITTIFIQLVFVSISRVSWVLHHGKQWIVLLRNLVKIGMLTTVDVDRFDIQRRIKVLVQRGSCSWSMFILSFQVEKLTAILTGARWFVHFSWESPVLRWVVCSYDTVNSKSYCWFPLIQSWVPHKILHLWMDTSDEVKRAATRMVEM
jgi:hypothetical protein